MKVVEILEGILDVLHSEQSQAGTSDHQQLITRELLHQILVLAYKTPHTEPIAVSTTLLQNSPLLTMEDFLLYQLQETTRS